jgi:hypothetical protein
VYSNLSRLPELASDQHCGNLERLPDTQSKSALAASFARARIIRRLARRKTAQHFAQDMQDGFHARDDARGLCARGWRGSFRRWASVRFGFH